MAQLRWLPLGLYFRYELTSMMRYRLLRKAALLISTICAGSAFARDSPPADLDNYVARVVKTFDVPGLSLAIVKDGKVVLAKGYGVRKLDEPTAVDENTLFGIGSNTKAFTAAALATLVDEGKISWDDRVYQRLPAFQMYDPYVSHEMTIRDLLTHRSGMGLGEGDLLFWPHTTYTRDEIVYRLRFMKPVSSFRSHFAYDNLLYMTAGQIIPAVTGESWDDYVRERILLPLGMTATNLSTAAFKPSNDYAWPHSKVDGKLQPVPFQNLDNVGPAGSINSSSAEMAKWLLLQLNHGKFLDREGRLFSERDSRENVDTADHPAHARSVGSACRTKEQFCRLRPRLDAPRLSRVQDGRPRWGRPGVCLTSDARARTESRCGDSHQCRTRRSWRLRPMLYDLVGRVGRFTAFSKS